MKVTNLQSGAQCMIDSSTFQERVRLMREFRQAHFNNDTNVRTLIIYTQVLSVYLTFEISIHARVCIVLTR